MTAVALRDLDSEPLIAKIANGAFLRDLAAQTGIDKRRLSEVLRKHPDYASAKESAIECQLDEAQEAIDTARKAADIARARELFRAAAWRAEREAPHRWGQRSLVTVDQRVRVEVSLDQDAAALLDAVRTVSSAQRDDVDGV